MGFHSQNSQRCCWTWFIVRTFASLSGQNLQLFGALAFRGPHITSNMWWCCGTLLRPYCYCLQEEWPKQVHRGCCYVAWQGVFPRGLYSRYLMHSHVLEGVWLSSKQSGPLTEHLKSFWLYKRNLFIFLGHMFRCCVVFPVTFHLLDVFCCTGYR